MTEQLIFLDSILNGGKVDGFWQVCEEKKVKKIQ